MFDRKDPKHQKTFYKLKFPKIDYIIVNLYPFSKVTNKEGDDAKINMIDIGGPAMIRSASKNFKFVTTISAIKYYSAFLKELDKNNGKTSLIFKKNMAGENFKLLSKYDILISNWFLKKNKTKTHRNKINIKYGENPYQKAYFNKNSKINIFSSQVSGKPIGYNNILDISEGLNCLSEFKEPSCVIVKHNNPCGVASANNVQKSFIKAYNSDPTSAFGGVILLNKTIDKKLATIINKKFFEIVVAPKFNNDALKILENKEKLIIINSKNLNKVSKTSYKSVNSGTLYQDTNFLKITKSKLRLVSNKKSSKKILEDLVFAYKVAKHVKSNAIVLANNKQTYGIGAGQMSRLDATRVALMKYNDFFKNKKFVCASDAFFPFEDNLKILNKYECQAVVQPNGSKNDKNIINYSKKTNLSLYFISSRVFKH